MVSSPFDVFNKCCFITARQYMCLPFLKTVGENRWCAQSMKISFGSTAALSINYSASICALSLSYSLIISCHWLLDWYPAGSFSPPSFLSSFLPFYLSGTLRDTEENRGKWRKGGEKKQPLDRKGMNEGEEDGTQRNMRLLSKNTSLGVTAINLNMHA